MASTPLSDQLVGGRFDDVNDDYISIDGRGQLRRGGVQRPPSPGDKVYYFW